MGAERTRLRLDVEVIPDPQNPERFLLRCESKGLRARVDLEEAAILFHLDGTMDWSEVAAASSEVSGSDVSVDRVEKLVTELVRLGLVEALEPQPDANCTPAVINDSPAIEAPVEEVAASEVAGPHEPPEVPVDHAVAEDLPPEFQWAAAAPQSADTVFMAPSGEESPVPMEAPSDPVEPVVEASPVEPMQETPVENPPGETAERDSSGRGLELELHVLAEALSEAEARLAQTLKAHQERNTQITRHVDNLEARNADLQAALERLEAEVARERKLRVGAEESLLRAEADRARMERQLHDAEGQLVTLTEDPSPAAGSDLSGGYPGNFPFQQLPGPNHW
jgi:hypothetical protein